MISVVYAVYNEENILARSLQSVKTLADEIVIVDGQSQDKTVAIAQSFGARIISTTNKANFHINKQLAIDAARGDLILQLDADEVVDRELAAFIIKTAAAGEKKITAWSLRRKNLFLNTWLKKGGQYPDPVIRLFWRGKAYLPQKDVHEQMVVQGKVALAPGHLLHFANPTLAAYGQKFNTYTSFKAQQLAVQGLPLNWRTGLTYLWLKPWSTFAKIYLRHRGYVDGAAGFWFAYFSGLHHRVAYLKYREAQTSTVILTPTKTPLTLKPRIFFPQNKLARTHAHRGVGRYSAWLLSALKDTGQVQLVKRAKQADIIHYLSFDLFARQLKKVARGQKLVVTIHDLIPLVLSQSYPVGWRGRFNFWRQKKLVQRSDLIITDSQASADDIQRLLGIKAEKIKVVYLAANPALAPAPPEQITRVRRDFVLPEKYLLYVGDINVNKNLPQLIKALKFLPEAIHLVFVGKNFVPAPIPEWQAITEQIALSEVTTRVHFLTTINDDQTLSALYTGALAYVQPSIYEGFGLPVLEALQAGTLVICDHNSSLPEVAGAHAFYTGGLQASDFVAAVEKVLALPTSRRQQLVRAGRAWATSFSWTKTAARMSELYQSLTT